MILLLLFFWQPEQGKRRIEKKQQRTDDDEDSLINSLARSLVSRRGLSYVNDDNNMLPDLHISRVNYS